MSKAVQTDRTPRRLGRRRGLALSAALAAVALCAASAASAEPAFPPRANSAWVYDPQLRNTPDKHLRPGHFTQALESLNANIRSGHQVSRLYIYAGDMEMYCPGKQPDRCSKDDFHIYYAHGNGGSHNPSVSAYARAGKHGEAPRIVPVIDGTVTQGGTLPGFNKLSRDQAAAFADLVARRVCAAPGVAGVQFDLEPFDVSSKNGQYYFYRRIAENFASRDFGCVDDAHPQGRSFSIFTTANRLDPDSAGGRNLRDIMHTASNGYVIDALYDLTSARPGQRTPIDKYRRVVKHEVQRMHKSASALDIKYQYAVPTAASVHEFARCQGPECRAQPASADNDNDQLAYVKAAFEAIKGVDARQDRRFLGIALWAWSPSVTHGDTRFHPAQPPEAVRRYLSANL